MFRFKSLKYLCSMVASKSCSWKAIHGDVETAVDVILDAASRISDSIPESSESLSLEPSSDSNPCEITVEFEGLCYVHSVCIVSTSRICEVYCQRQPGGETDYICTARGEIDDSSVKPEGNPFYEAEVELVNADAWAALKIRLLSLISKSRLEIKKVTICAEVAETSPTSTSDNEKENTTDGTASMLTMLMPSMLQIVRGMSDGVENRRMQQNQPSSTLKEEESVTSKQLEMQKKSEEFQNEMRYRIQRLEMVVVRMETYLHTAFGKLDERVGKLEEQVRDGFSSLNKDRTAHEHIYRPSSPVEITPKGTAQVCSDDEDSSSIVSEVLMQETAVNSVVPQVSDQDAGGSLSITSVKENSNLVTQASQQLQQVPEETTRVLAPSEEPQLNQDDRGPSQSSSETSHSNNMDHVEVGAANETPPVQGLHDHVEVGAANETPPMQELAEGNQGESKDTIDSTGESKDNIDSTGESKDNIDSTGKSKDTIDFDTTENEQSLQEEGLTGIGAENLGAEAEIYEGGKSNTDLIDFTATNEIVPDYVHVDEGEGGYVDDVFDLQPRPSEEDFHVATAIDTCTDLLSI